LKSIALSAILDTVECLKTRYFNKWSRREKIDDACLWDAIKEFKEGLYDAALGKHLFKKRIPLPGRGKRGGARTILFYQQERMLIFCFGFSKSDKKNIDHKEKKALTILSDTWIKLSKHDLDRIIKQGELILIEGGQHEK